MQSVTENSVLDVSASVQACYAPGQENYIAAEDVTVAVETVSQNPESVTVKKTAVFQKTLYLREEVVLPGRDCFGAPVFLCPSCSVVESTCMDDSLGDEMDFGSQVSSKMELGSQESADVRMDMSSQESVSSKMDILSQEYNCLDESLEDERNVIDSKTETNLKRKFAHEEASDVVSCARDVSLSLRERVVALREAAVDSRERLVKMQEDNLKNHRLSIKAKRLKKM